MSTSSPSDQFSSPFPTSSRFSRRKYWLYDVKNLNTGRRRQQQSVLVRLQPQIGLHVTVLCCLLGSCHWRRGTAHSNCWSEFDTQPRPRSWSSTSVALPCRIFLSLPIQASASAPAYLSQSLALCWWSTYSTLTSGMHKIKANQSKGLIICNKENCTAFNNKILDTPTPWAPRILHGNTATLSGIGSQKKWSRVERYMGRWFFYSNQR